MAESSRAKSGSSSNRRKKLSGPEAVEQIRAQLPQLIGRPIESVLGMRRADDDGGWTVTVQVVELERIPNSTDVLGSYAVMLAPDGEIAGYERTRRFYRSQADEG
jgi:hypothetical protein